MIYYRYKYKYKYKYVHKYIYNRKIEKKDNILIIKN
jgi:hypothetical protein